MIPRETVDLILDSAKIEEVVGDFVTLKRRGANLIACCPFHNEKTPSFYVSPSKGIYKCFGCGKSGTAVGFVMEHESLTYPEALRYLAKKYHIEVKEREETAEDIAARQRSESLMLVSEFALKFFRDQLKTPGGQVGYAYFKSRGLQDDTIEKFGLGWAPQGRSNLLDAARAAGFKEEYLVDSGLCFRAQDGRLMDRFYDRVVFPIYNVNGRVIAFGCRTLKNDKTVAKYVNSPETDIYQKRFTLYGLSHAKSEVSRKDSFILVEGYLDVISMHQKGICNVAASSGTSLTVEQVRLIKRFTDNVTIIYDGDSAGIHAALRGIGLLLEGGLNVKVVLLPDGDDPDSFSRKHTREEVEAFIDANAQDFIGFKTQLLLDEAGRDPIKRAGLINDIADTIALIPDPIKRSVYVPLAARQLDIQEDLIFQRIKRTRERQLAEKRREQERAQEHGHGQDAPFPEDEPYMEPDIDPDSYVGVPLQGDPLVDVPEMAPCEKDLLGFMLNSGRTVLEFPPDSPYRLPDGEKITVAEFICSVLEQDAEQMRNSLMRRVFNQYMDLYDKGLSQEQTSARLLSDPDAGVRALCEDLIGMKYNLTVKNFEASLTAENTTLVTYVPRALLLWNLRRVELDIKEQTRALGACIDDEKQAMEAMEKIKELNTTKNMLANKLGRI